MADPKNLIRKFEYGEKLKSEVSIANQLLEQLVGLKDDQFNGGLKIVEAYLNSLMMEIKLAQKVIGSKVVFSKTARKLTEAVGRITLKEYDEARACFSEALNDVTTVCAESFEALAKLNLT
jgi:molecular chaperone DnaK (HSP70)